MTKKLLSFNFPLMRASKWNSFKSYYLKMNRVIEIATIYPVFINVCLQDCFEFCENLSQEHLKDLTDALFVPTSNQQLLKKVFITHMIRSLIRVGHRWQHLLGKGGSWTVHILVWFFVVVFCFLFVCWWVVWCFFLAT